MEFIWRGANVGVNVDMLTHVLHTHYSAPKGFDWEDGAPAVGDYNVDERSRTLCDEIKVCLLFSSMLVCLFAIIHRRSLH